VEVSSPLIRIAKLRRVWVQSGYERLRLAALAARVPPLTVEDREPRIESVVVKVSDLSGYLRCRFEAAQLLGTLRPPGGAESSR
jgi:hypothetical protein